MRERNEDRAGLNDDRVHLPVRIVHGDLHERFNDPQMCRRTDGQELGKTFDNTEKD
jgi:hypothetical protein